MTKWFKNSGPAMDWLLDKADQYGATYTLYAGYSRSAILPEEPDFHTFQAGSFAIPKEAGYFVPTALLYQSCLDQGVEFLFGHTAEQLVQDESGKVTGVVVKAADGTYQQFNASKGVVLATGDIAGDQEMREAYLEPLFVDMRSDYMPQGANTGDGHKMGMWAGGVMQDGPLPNALHPQGGSMFHGPLHVREQGRQALLQRGELGTGQVHPDHEADRPRGLLHLRQELPHRQQGQPQPWRRHVLGTP